MAYQTLKTSTHGDSIAIASFNRPLAANALNMQMAQELKRFFTSLPASCRVVILTGEGKHFCAGADLKERRGMNKAQWQKQHHAFESALQALLKCPVPVVAAVGGAAMGGGLELALACDFIYASSTAWFALTEVTLGIMPGMGGTQTLARTIGTARAKEMIFAGKSFTANEALESGMVNKLSAPESLLAEVLATARAIAGNAPLAVKAAKKAMNQGASQPLPQALKTDLLHYNRLLTTKDRQEGVNAFNEKRKPAFTGK